MKILALYLVIMSTLLSANTIDITYISKKIDKIKNAVKMPLEPTYKVYDPFATAKPILKKKDIIKTKRTVKPIIIQTILNDKAFINGRWYNIGDNIQSFSIKDIREDGIVLVKNNKVSIVRLKGVKNIMLTKELDR